MLLSNYRLGQVFAFIGAVGVHTGLGVWAMQPSNPVVIPQQQVIQVAMVAPSMPVKAEQKPVEVEKKIAAIPPKQKGMKKVVEKKEVKQEKKIEEKPKKIASASAPLTSGRQSEDATQKNAALTEPKFNAKYLRNTPPEYPYAARRRGTEGKVVLDVSVTTEGRAGRVKVRRSSGSGLLDKTALAAVENWRFVPARQGSKLVEANVLVPIEFKLN